MKHLSRDEQLTLIESAEGGSHPHLRECARCRAEVEEARASWLEARLVSVPEPSPLFWAYLTARVSEQIATDPTAPRRSSMGLRVLVPLAVGVVALVLAVVIDQGPSRPGVVPSGPSTAENRGTLVAGMDAEDPSWSLLGEMAGEFDIDTLSDSIGTSENAGAEAAVYQLSAEERVNLAELLRAETGRERAEQ
jgi:hypothetical protein